MATLREMIDVPDQIMGMQEAVSGSRTIYAGGPGSGRHKGLMRDIAKGAQLASMAKRVRLAGFLNKLNAHLQQGGDITQQHHDTLMDHFMKILDKSDRLEDKETPDSPHTTKSDTKLATYDKLSDNLEKIGQKMREGHSKW